MLKCSSAHTLYHVSLCIVLLILCVPQSHQIVYRVCLCHIIIIIIIIITDRTIPNNKPDIIIRDNEKGTCMLIDVAISGDRNVIKKEGEKILSIKILQ